MSTDETLRTGTSETQAQPAARPRYWPRRLRILRRLGTIALAGLLLAIFAAGVVRTVRMFGLPDVGDPFADRKAARAQAQASASASAHARPRRDDAVGFYLRAIAALKRLDANAVGPRFNPSTSWSSSPQAVQEWRGRNDEALRLFRDGAESDLTPPGPDAQALGPESNSSLISNQFFSLLWLTVLEGSRLEDQGDLPGAWSWYRVFLRATYHMEQDAGVWHRLIGNGQRTRFRPRLAAWAANPRTTAAQLRRALADVQACKAMQPSELEALESHYRRLLRELARGQWAQHPPERGPVRGPQGWEVPQPLVYVWWQGLRFLDNEPERSRRVTDLAFANWRAWLARPDALRPRPAVRVVVLKTSQSPQSIELYPVGSDALPAARRMSPQRLVEWLGTTRDAKFPLGFFWSTFQQVRRQDRAAYRDLLIHLAEQLYERENGVLPDNPETLIGTCLKSLPDDGSSELDDGTTPTVEFP
jgi:hypothetical protein